MSASTFAFWRENLQESVQTAGQQNSTLLCFVTDGSPTSLEWEKIIAEGSSSNALSNATIRLRIRKDSQEHIFLNGVCPIQNVPALVFIRNGQIQEKMEYPIISLEQLKQKLSDQYPTEQETSVDEAKVREREEEDEEEDKDEQGEGEIETPSTNTKLPQYLRLGPSTGRMRLPNNAYDALRDQTVKWEAQSISPPNILQLQLRLMENITSLKAAISSVRTRETDSPPSLPEDAIDRLLRTPASSLQSAQTSSPSSSTTPAVQTPVTQATPATTAPPSPPVQATPGLQPTAPSDAPSSSSSQSTQNQRVDYIRQQRARETSQKLERERIKAQIKSDREERRRLDSLRKQSELADLRRQNSTTTSPSSTDIRIQVRTFDGSTLRTSFLNTSNITNDVRPWIDQTNKDATRQPYNLKIILTPLPNRTIEASEEERTLPELGIEGSATLVMVPVKGAVDSYASSTSATMSVFGGVLGATGRALDGLLWMVGLSQGSSDMRQEQQQEDHGSGSSATVRNDDSNAGTSQVKVRTLADQRAEEDRKRGNQLYNGNSLDFQGRKDDDDDDDVIDSTGSNRRKND